MLCLKKFAGGGRKKREEKKKKGRKKKREIGKEGGLCWGVNFQERIRMSDTSGKETCCPDSYWPIRFFHATPFSPLQQLSLPLSPSWSWSL